MIPMLMGSMPTAIPACIDCGAWFWLGFVTATAIGIFLALLFIHTIKGD